VRGAVEVIDTGPYCFLDGLVELPLALELAPILRGLPPSFHMTGGARRDRRRVVHELRRGACLDVRVRRRSLLVGGGLRSFHARGVGAEGGLLGDEVDRAGDARRNHPFASE